MGLLRWLLVKAQPSLFPSLASQAPARSPASTVPRTNWLSCLQKCLQERTVSSGPWALVRVCIRPSTGRKRTQVFSTVPSEGRPGCLQVSLAVPTASHLTRGRTALSHLRRGLVVNTVSGLKGRQQGSRGSLSPVGVGQQLVTQQFTRCRLNVLLPSRWPQWARVPSADITTVLWGGHHCSCAVGACGP